MWAAEGAGREAVPIKTKTAVISQTSHRMTVEEIMLDPPGAVLLFTRVFV